MSDAPVELIISAISLGITVYFWMVQANRERPKLTFFQLGSFRANCRRIPDCADKKRLCIQQLDSCGILIANNSTRQNSVVLFHCKLNVPGQGTYCGDWGFVGDDHPPWNIGPESTIALSLACFFDVPQDFEVPEDFQLEIDFVTASGRRFCHVFHKQAPSLASNAEAEYAKAA